MSRNLFAFFQFVLLKSRKQKKGKKLFYSFILDLSVSLFLIYSHSNFDSAIHLILSKMFLSSALIPFWHWIIDSALWICNGVFIERYTCIFKKPPQFCIISFGGFCFACICLCVYVCMCICGWVFVYIYVVDPQLIYSPNE